MKNTDIEKLYKDSDELDLPDGIKAQIIERAASELRAGSEVKAKSTRTVTPSIFKRLIPIAACFLFAIILFGGAALGLINEKYQTVYIDVNPSVELDLNRFGTVRYVEYKNTDAREALKNVELVGLCAEDAIEEIIDAYDEEGYFTNGAELYIGALSEKNKNIDKLLSKLEKRAESVKGDRRYSVNVSKLTAEDRSEADEYGISPGKYRVIAEIIEKYPNLTVEELKDRSMSELKELLSDKSDKENGKKSHK